jgi:cytochrome c oxidase subunit 2
MTGGKKTAPPLDGNKLMEDNKCFACHSKDGSKKIGPTFKNIFGREVTIEKDGEEITLTSDREYLRRAIADPKSEVVKGYRPIMRKFELSPEEVEVIIDALERMSSSP